MCISLSVSLQCKERGVKVDYVCTGKDFVDLLVLCAALILLVPTHIATCNACRSVYVNKFALQSHLD